jgi:endogenous inhibitor of DNA gyrase (YacG/DUF329 family)
VSDIENSRKKIIVSCPTCNKDVVWGNLQLFRPFCSERCKLIDLGEWAAEEKKIPGDPISELDIDSLL